MSQENVEVIKALFAGWERGDRDVVGMFDSEVEFERYGGEVAVTRRARGIEEMTAALVEWVGEWSNLRFEAERFVDLGDRVLVLARHRGVGRRSGLAMDHLEADVFTLLDGKVVRWEAHWDPGEAQRAALDPKV
jgi:ketosteroid isomerase-like protein